MGLNLDCVGSLASDQLESVKKNLEDLVFEIFIQTAYEYYVAARFMALNGMQRQFYWSALQVIEKCFKAMLLFNGEKVKNRDHKILGMYDGLNRINCIGPLEELKPNQGLLESSHIIHWNSEKLRDFVEKIATYGHSDSRYDCVSYEFDISDLFKLDCFVSKTGFNFQNVLEDNESVEKFFYEHNFYFSSPEYSGVPMEGLAFQGIRSTKISRLLNGKYGNYHAYRRWIRENIKYNGNAFSADGK